MIKADQLVIQESLSFENPTIFENHESPPVINLFEQFQFAFKCDGKLYSCPDYFVTLIRLSRPKEEYKGIKVKRITINFDIPHENATIIPQERWAQYRIPTLLHSKNQLVFATKEGLYITTDYNVSLVQH